MSDAALLLDETIINAVNKTEFDVSINTIEFQKSLYHINSIIEKKSTNEMLLNVKLDAVDGYLVLSATDMELSITDKIKANINKFGSITIHAATLYDIVKKLVGNEEVNLFIENEGGLLNIKAGHSKFSLPYLTVRDFPALDKGEVLHRFNLDSKEMMDLLEKTSFAASTEETRYNLNGVYLHVDTEENTSVQSLVSVATDGHRLSCMKIELKGQFIDNMDGVILPSKTVSQLTKLLGENNGQITIFMSKSKICFEIGDIIFISKLIDGVFPPYKTVIPYDNNKIIKINNKLLKKAVDRVATVLPDKLSSGVKFVFTENKLTLFANNEKGFGSAEEELDIESSQSINDKLQIGFNFNYILNVTSVIKGDDVEIMLLNETSSALLKDPIDPRALYVIMPMRVS